MRRTATISSYAFLLFFCLSGQAAAITIGAQSISGLMQQPTSQYYHLVYGGNLEVLTESEGVIGRFSYLERPKFVASGFVDQETFLSATIGSKITKAKNHGLYAFAGGAYAAGYIRPEDESSNLDRRGFQMRAATFGLEYGGKWRSFFASVSHQTIIGVINKQQSDINVAWPYQFYLANLGMRL